MKRTALFDKHVSLGAKIVSFCWLRNACTVFRVTEEHFAVREKAGMFDVSHMGQFLLKDREVRNFFKSYD